MFWSEGAGLGTVDDHSYLPDVNRDKPLSEEPWFCLGTSRWLSPNVEARNKSAGVGVGDPRTTALEWESDCP